VSGESFRAIAKFLWVGIAAVVLAACSASTGLPPAPETIQSSATGAADYRVGPLDTVQVFVWNAPEFSVTVPVRPDGKISTPLIQDLQAAGKTPSQLGDEIEQRLRQYMQDPVVTVIVSNFSGPFDQQIRVVGEATEPRAIPYRANMTLLDVMIEVGGLTDFAAGNRAVIVRRAGEQQQTYNARLDDLLKEGDISANVPVMPGDVVIIPQSWF
jgi:polysaccharide biosynthesis/export protein